MRFTCPSDSGLPQIPLMVTSSCLVTGRSLSTILASPYPSEKDINLDIVLRLKGLLDNQDGIKVYYTRTEDIKPSLQQRVDLANDVEADFFLSVHCNSNETRSLNGMEVLFDSRQDVWEGMNSRRFAEIILEKMDGYAGFKNRGLVPREHNLSIIKYPGYQAIPSGAEQYRD